VNVANDQPTYWVVGSGDYDHDCSDVFLDYGIMAVGPGHLGDFNKNEKTYDKSKKLKKTTKLK
jgi:hypothetical protein